MVKEFLRTIQRILRYFVKNEPYSLAFTIARQTFNVNVMNPEPSGECAVLFIDRCALIPAASTPVLVLQKQKQENLIAIFNNHKK